MEKITGRTDDMIILRGVNLFPTQIEELILRVPGLAPHFQLVLSRPERLDELTVRVEARIDARRAGELRSERGARRPDQGDHRRHRRRRRARAGPIERSAARPSACSTSARAPPRLLDSPYSRYGSIVGR